MKKLNIAIVVKLEKFWIVKDNFSDITGGSYDSKSLAEKYAEKRLRNVDGGELIFLDINQNIISNYTV